MAIGGFPFGNPVYLRDVELYLDLSIVISDIVLYSDWKFF